MIDKHSFLPLGTASKFPALSIKLLATILFKEYPITIFSQCGIRAMGTLQLIVSPLHSFICTH